MEQDNLTITLKRKNNNEQQVQKKKISDDYPTLDRAGQVTLICLHTGHNRLNSHMNRRGESRVPSPTTLFRARTGITMYVWNRRSNNRTNMENMSIIPTSHRSDMVRRNIRSCM